jgi:hypothetical protein
MRMRVVRIGILLTVAARLLPAVVIEQSHWHDFAFTAQISGNPFDVDLRGEFTGPGGVQLVVPGFYDGGNTWIIRFSPTAVGHWSMRTSSPAAALNGRLETNIECSANTNPAVHGGLLVDPVNRHHFLYEDGTRYFLMGYEADWLWAVDMKDPDRKVMRHLIDQIASRGFNHLIVNVFAYDTSWSKGKMNEWDYGPPEMFAFGGSNEKPDYSRLNPAFFKVYDGMMQALQDKGIVAHLMFKVYNKMVNWPPPGSENEQRYFRYVTARYQAFCNVVWDFSKESYNEPDKKLQKRLTDLIRSTDGYHRLTTAHDNDIYDWNPGLNSNLDFRTDQEHKDWKEMLIFDRELRQWPVVNSELYYERGVDDLPSYPIKQDWQEMVRGAYEVYLSGGYFVYYYDNTAWDVVKPDPEPPGALRFQILQKSLASLPYWKMEPKPELAAGGPCLAIPGLVYAFYVPSGPARGGPPAGTPNATMGAAPGIRPGPSAALARGSAREIVTNLTGLTGAATAEWINTWTGDRTEERIDRPGVYQFNRPGAFGNAPALLIVRADR